MTLDIPVSRDRDVALIRAIILTSSVWRWHTNRAMAHVRETVADHSRHMVELHVQLFGKPSDDMEFAIRVHDAHEAFLGDMPSPAKTIYRELDAAYDKAAFEIDVRNGWSVLMSNEDDDRLKFLDRLSAYLMVQRHAPAELDKDEWQTAREWLESIAQGLGADIRGLL